ncbi:Galactokinase [Candidatus Sulfopaludibacter sp. SbA3]|nr:Galactokinase [Candidatus Sulfopaludibacter sp. SbA3]
MIEPFRERFGSAEGLRVFRAPGRTNLIGEHTDYNMGFVLPVALDLATYVAAAPSRDGKLRIYSEHRAEAMEWDIDAVAALTPQHHWSDYPLGVAHELIAAGFALHPANLMIRSTVPEGSGLSSSAALEVSSALAFLNGRTLEPLELAKLCQRAERNFVGMPCGIMDQYISVFGREHSAVEIDCRSLGHRLVSLPAEITFVAVNTMVKHALAGSAYKDRVQECAAAVKGVQTQFPEAQSLRDVTPEQFEQVAPTLHELIARRGRHVVTETARVGRFVDASSRGDLSGMGALMVQSHRSLQHDYEVSCAELDFLVDAALKLEGVFGSRMTGGGFGGCTVTMLRPDAVAAFSRDIAQAYQQQFAVIPAIYPCKPSDGAAEVKNFETIPAAQ